MINESTSLQLFTHCSSTIKSRTNLKIIFQIGMTRISTTVGKTKKVSDGRISASRSNIQRVLAEMRNADQGM